MVTMRRHVEIEVKLFLMEVSGDGTVVDCEGEIHEGDGGSWFLGFPLEIVISIYIVTKAVPFAAICLFVGVGQPDANDVVDVAVVKEKV